METSELLKKVRRIEIKTKGLTRNIFAGEYHSAFKGLGMRFREVREYEAGDDIRSIDWKVSARLRKPYVKVFEEERELTVMLLVDVSGSKFFGTKNQLKEELVTELAAVIAFSTIQNNDKVGVIFFSDKIEKFIPPKKGKGHVLRIIRELLDFKATSKRTNIAQAIRYLTNVQKRKTTAFVISDFLDSGYEDALKIACNKHDIIVLRTFDQRESLLPSMGLVKFEDSETGQSAWIDTSDKRVRIEYAKFWNEADAYLKTILMKNGIDSASIRTDQSYVQPLMTLFKKRIHSYG